MIDGDTNRGMGYGRVALGAILVALGVLFLLGQVLDINIGRLAWPLFIILPGLVLCVIALAVRGRGGEGLFIAGSVVTTTGLLLFYQNSTHHWESWAYAWALIAPGSIGLGQLVYGTLMGQGNTVRAGARTTTIGLAIFLIGVAFFEGMIGISGRGFGQYTAYAFPAALILLGVLLLFGNLFPGREPARRPASAARPAEPVAYESPRGEPFIDVEPNAEVSPGEEPDASPSRAYSDEQSPGPASSAHSQGDLPARDPQGSAGPNRQPKGTS